MHNTNFSLVRIDGLSYFKEPYVEQFYKVTKVVMKGITLEFPCRNLQFLLLTSLKRLVASSPGRWRGAWCPPSLTVEMVLNVSRHTGLPESSLQKQMHIKQRGSI